MVLTVDELRVPAFYFMNERKLWQRVQQLLKLQIQRDQWFRKMIHQNFVNDWIEKPFTPWYLRRTKAFIIEQFKYVFSPTELCWVKAKKKSSSVYIGFEMYGCIITKDPKIENQKDIRLKKAKNTFVVYISV